MAAAIDSALSQTLGLQSGGSRAKGSLEVIVVDDGSTDGSLDVVMPYGRRVILISKANGGQASAMNAGFKVSRGQIVLFLDSDDMLLPDTAERVAGTWNDRISKVHFRLQQTASDGTPLPGMLLPPYRPLPSGDLKLMLWQFGSYPSPPTTGNAFSRRFLEQIMPIPEGIYRKSPDAFLCTAAPLFGEIGSLGGIGGYWRRHEGNASSVGMAGLKENQQISLETVRLVSELAATVPSHAGLQALWPQHLKEGVILAKFGGEVREGRDRFRVALKALVYVRVIMHWPQYNVYVRAKFAAWAVGMALLPRRVLAAIPGIAGRSIRLDAS